MPQVCIRIFWAYLTNRFVTEKNGKKRKKKLETLFKNMHLCSIKIFVDI